jgi:hypothetical protein
VSAGILEATRPHARLLASAVAASRVGWWLSSFWPVDPADGLLIIEILVASAIVCAIYAGIDWLLGERTALNLARRPELRQEELLRFNYEPQQPHSLT